MKTVLLSRRSCEQISRAVAKALCSVEASTECGMWQAGLLGASLLPWDCELWQLRVGADSEAVLVDGLPRLAGEDSSVAGVITSLVMTVLHAGAPWGCLRQGSVFQHIVSAPQYAAGGHVPDGDESQPHVACRQLLWAAPERIALGLDEESAGLQVGWLGTAQLVSGMPKALLRQTLKPDDTCNGAPPRCDSRRVGVPLLLGHDASGGALAWPGTCDTESLNAAPGLQVAALAYLRCAAEERTTWINLQPSQRFIVPNRCGLQAVRGLGAGGGLLRSYWSRDLSHHRAAGRTDRWMLFDDLALGAALATAVMPA